MEMANLVPSNIMYDQTTDVITVDMTNSGNGYATNMAYGWYLLYAASDECSNGYVDAAFLYPAFLSVSG